MYLDSEKKKKSSKSTVNQLLTQVLLKARSLCLLTVSLI